MDASTALRLQGWLFSRIPLLGTWLRRRALRELAADGSPKALEILALGLDRLPDPQAQAQIQALVEAVHDARQIDAACRAWAQTRSPHLGQLILERGWTASGPPPVRLLSALQANRPEVVCSIEADDLPALLAICRDADPTLAERARACLEKLDHQGAIDALCLAWARQRDDALLAAALSAGRYIARRPPEVRILTALLRGEPQALAQDGAEIVPQLAAAVDDPDPRFATLAAQAVAGLANRAAQEAACQALLHADSPALQAAVLAGGYLPANAAQRALFFFLTGQWERYESLDFDHSQLRAVYSAAGADLRQRINSRLRQAGRPSYLNILVGGDESARLKQMNGAEIELMLQLIKAERQWLRLWGLIPRLPLAWALQTLDDLQAAAWQPAESADQELFAQLAGLNSPQARAASRAILSHMQPAVERARVRLLHGRLNGLAFDPLCSHVALGTSRRRVVVWDYRAGALCEKISASSEGEFQHSIGEIAYTRRGELVFAERTQGAALCRVYLQRGGRTQAVYTETGSVTALEPAGEASIFLTGRSQFASLLDFSGPPVQMTRRVFPFWARAACVHPARPLAALLHHSAMLVELPELRPAAPERDAGQMLSCGAFLPDSEDLLVGKLTGDTLLLARRKNGFAKPELLKYNRHAGRVIGLAALRRYPLVVSAGSDGLLEFTGWPDRSRRGRAGRLGEQIQSLHLAADESFLAVAHSDTFLSLWDLRIQELPGVFSRPLLEASPNQLAALRASAGPDANGEPPLTPAGQSALQAAVLLLQFRFRHDSEIDAAPEIKAGEFDIEIE